MTLAVAASATAVVLLQAPAGLSSASQTVSAQGKISKVARLVHLSSLPTAPVARANAPARAVVPFRSPGGAFPASKSHGAGAPVATGTPLAAGRTPYGPTVLHIYNGLSDVDQFAVDGYHDTPPDQGLCVGNDPSLGGNPTVVFELVNSLVRETDRAGALLRPDANVTTFFADANAFSDPRCFWDPATQTFFFTIISWDFVGDTFNDVAVLNSNGFSLYQFDTSIGGVEFGDQPHVGFDNNALYMTTDEFPNCCPGYDGTLLQVVSKPQLVAQAATVNMTSFGPLALNGGIPVLTMQPAFGDGTNTEYLLNSFPYDAAGNNLATSNVLGFWKVTGDTAVTTGIGTTTLTGMTIPSETYAFTVPAASTGDGSVNGSGITSEMFLNPDDDRLEQVQAVVEGGKVYLWTSLNTALNISGDTATRDGAAVFRINAQQAAVDKQGYIGVKGAYMLYPATIHSPTKTAITFTLTSPSINPEFAWTTLNTGGIFPGGSGGYGPHVSFSDFFFGEARWGDYSAAVLDPGGSGIWLATETIPPPALQSPVDNWGTEVWEISN
jgi:hypothetical protein